jgi:tetratricopeptide (TPR) repeat protein
MHPPRGTSPDDHESAYELFQRGTRMLAERHFGASAVLLERALTLEPGKASILEALGRAYYNQGAVSLAAERFGAIVETDPLAHYAHFGLGLAQARLGDERSARRHLRLAVRMQPDNEAYRQALARVDAAA